MKYRRNEPPAVNNISFEVQDGEILGFAGLNGAGKTTTIRAVSGILLPTSGNITIDGHDIVSDKVGASRNMGWVPEFPNFEPNALPIPMLLYYAGFYGITGKKARELAMDLLKQVDLERAMKKKLRSFSQGMKKRFSLASALISDPGNFLFDETLNGLDPEGISYLRKLMLRLKSEGKAILLSSHILSELENLADRTIIIHRGEVIETISRDRMRNLGKPVLKARISNLDEQALTLLSRYGTVRREGDLVTVTDLTSGEGPADDINATLIKAGYRVASFNVQGASLEEYFVQLMEERR